MFGFSFVGADRETGIFQHASANVHRKEKVPRSRRDVLQSSGRKSHTAAVKTAISAPKDRRPIITAMLACMAIVDHAIRGRVRFGQIRKAYANSTARELQVAMRTSSWYS